MARTGELQSDADHIALTICEAVLKPFLAVANWASSLSFQELKNRAQKPENHGIGHLHDCADQHTLKARNRAIAGILKRETAAAQPHLQIKALCRQFSDCSATQEAQCSERGESTIACHDKFIKLAK
jgi:hypothetical protein